MGCRTESKARYIICKATEWINHNHFSPSPIAFATHPTTAMAMIVHVAGSAMCPLHGQQHALLHGLRRGCRRLLGLRIEVDDASGTDAHQAQQQRQKCAKRSHFLLSCLSCLNCQFSILTLQVPTRHVGVCPAISGQAALPKACTIRSDTLNLGWPAYQRCLQLIRCFIFFSFTFSDRNSCGQTLLLKHCILSGSFFICAVNKERAVDGAVNVDAQWDRKERYHKIKGYRALTDM